MKPIRFVFVALVLTLILSLIPGCEFQSEEADSYVALVPRVLYAGETGTVSVSLFKGDKPVTDSVTIALLKDGNPLLQLSRVVPGTGNIEFAMPDIPKGVYAIEVKGANFEGSAQVMVDRGALVFLETDKPIYKPGQTIQIRVVTLNSDLLPVTQPVTVEIQDAQGIKVFKKAVETDQYGMSSLELPLSAEPNLGVWKLTALAAEQKAQLDVRVEKYVLPKYEVKVELPREWFLVSEPIKGKVKAEYSFGKPVAGELEIKALRYVGKWETFQTFSKAIDGEADFEIRPAGYVAGVPGAGGMGNVTLEVVVTEKTTGYQEKTTRLLTVSATSVSLQVIPEAPVFKPSLPFSFLVIAETPDNQPVDTQVTANIVYLGKDFNQVGKESKQLRTEKGKALLKITPPKDSAALTIEVSSGEASASKAMEAGYSPSGNFIHLEQISLGPLKVGDEARFKVNSTSEAVNFYYEVISRGRVVFSDFTSSSGIALKLTPMMAPSARLLVYQILPNSEVAADYLPFNVEASYPNQIEVGFSKEKASPGEELAINIQSEGKAKVGLAAVDRSVFILAENRLNLQQVFDELERLYMKPQIELHSVSIYSSIATKGAQEIFKEAGVAILTNKKVPQGEEFKRDIFWAEGGGIARDGALVPLGWDKMAVATSAPTPTLSPQPAPGSGLAEVQRIRQYFPETWLWTEIVTDAQGKASLKVQVPDTITTWMLRAVAVSPEKGLGIAESALIAFQPFFVTVDLPYSAIRGEEFPVKVAIYNYLDQKQTVFVGIEGGSWFDLLDADSKSVEIAGSDIGSVEFKIKPRELGVGELKITARSSEAADAIIKTLIVVPEGVEREVVDNLVLSAGSSKVVDFSVPQGIVEGSARAYLAVTGSYLTQTIEGLEKLIQMPFGCGEQNMLMFAPDVYITRYLRETGQLKPEIMAKAEKLMITGYQRELTYRRSDGSFSAFGQQDQEGSLWLTAFVLKCFAQARGVIYIDESVLAQAKEWITRYQKPDGSFEAVGFVHHSDMMGGLKGKTALTAYIAIALLEAGDKDSSARATGYLEGQLSQIDDPYTMAITAYALELAGSPLKDEAYRKLMEMAQADEDGLHWGGGSGDIVPATPPEKPGFAAPRTTSVVPSRSASIEATGYALLALLQHGDRMNAGRAARWLVSKRNAYGGFGSTQDTVVALQSLTEYAGEARADVDLKVTVTAGKETRTLVVNGENFDVLQMIEVPLNGEVSLRAEGKGEAVAQAVRRFNLPAPEQTGDIFHIAVDYDTARVEVDDLVTVSVKVEFDPPLPIKAEMAVLDISVPTGFTPVPESLEKAVATWGKIKRYDVAGRKVIFYITEMAPGEKLAFDFQVRAMYPVKGKDTDSKAYSYYKPEMKGETMSRGIEVVESK